MKPFNDKKCYILLPALGRMGNQFQNSAVFEAFSEHYQKRGLNLSLLCHLDKLGRRGLKTLVIMLLGRLLVRLLKSEKIRFFTGLFVEFDTSMLKSKEVFELKEFGITNCISKKPFIVLDVYPLSMPKKFMDEQRAHIFSRMKVSSKDAYSIDNRIRKLRQNADLIIAIHIRHGDYKEWKGGRYFVGLEQFSKVVMKFEESLKDPGSIAYFLATDGNADDFSMNGRHIECIRGSEFEDWYFMSKCDYIIRSRSTYSRWASYYGEVPSAVVTKKTDNLVLSDFEVADLGHVLADN